MSDYSLDKNLLAQRLKEARQKKKIKQKDLSELTEISITTISAYETFDANSNPSLVNICKIANALNVSIDWLCGFSNSPETIENRIEENNPPKKIDTETFLLCMFILLNKTKLISYADVVSAIEKEIEKEIGELNDKRFKDKLDDFQFRNSGNFIELPYTNFLHFHCYISDFFIELSKNQYTYKYKDSGNYAQNDGERIIDELAIRGIIAKYSKYSIKELFEVKNSFQEAQGNFFDLLL